MTVSPRRTRYCWPESPGEETAEACLVLWTREAQRLGLKEGDIVGCARAWTPSPKSARRSSSIKSSRRTGPRRAPARSSLSVRFGGCRFALLRTGFGNNCEPVVVDSREPQVRTTARLQSVSESAPIVQGDEQTAAAQRSRHGSRTPRIRGHRSYQRRRCN